MLGVYAGVYTVLATSGLVLLRRSLGGASLAEAVRNPLLVVGGMCYAASFLTFLLSLRRFEVLTVFPVFGALAYIGVTVASVVFLGEALRTERVLGILLAMVAVVLLGRQ